MDPSTPHPSVTSSPLFFATMNTTSNGIATSNMSHTEPTASPPPPPPPHPISLQQLLFLEDNNNNNSISINIDCTLQQPQRLLLQTKRLQIQTLAKQIRDRRMELKRKIAPSLARSRGERSDHDQLLVSQFRDWNRQTRQEFLQHLQTIPESQLSPAQARMMRRFHKEKNSSNHQHSHFFLDNGAEISWRRISSSASSSGGPPPTSNSLASLYQSMERLGIANQSGASLAPIPGLEPATPPVTSNYHSSMNNIIHHNNNNNSTSIVTATTITTTAMMQDGHNVTDRMM